MPSFTPIFMGNMLIDVDRQTASDHVAPAVTRSRDRRLHGCPRGRPWLLRTYTLVLLLTVSLLAQSVHGGSCTPCPAGCSCTLTEKSSYECIVDCSYAGLQSVPPENELPDGQETIVALYLNNNYISGLSSLQFGSFDALRTLNLSYNDLASIDQNAFSGLGLLQTLDLSSCNLTTLSDNTFSFLISLSELHLENNPWKCDCNITWLHDWVSDNDLIPANQTDVTCNSPLPVIDLNMFSMNASQFSCEADASNFASCHLDTRDGSTESVLFSDPPFTAESREDCHLRCLHEGRDYGYWGPRGHCLCGSQKEFFDGGSCGCPSLLEGTEPLPGSLLCGFLYIDNIFSTRLQDSFGGIRPFSTYEDAGVNITYSPAANVTDVTCNLGNGSAELLTSDLEIYHQFFLRGDYSFTCRGRYGNASVVSRAPLRTHDPIVTRGIEAPVYASIRETLNLRLRYVQGSGSTVVWKRTSVRGHIVYNFVSNKCPVGWFFSRNLCHQAFSNYNSTYEEAKEECSSRHGSLVIFKDWGHQKEIANAIGPGEYFIYALKDQDQYYWEGTGRNAYFNTTHVSNSEDTDCVILYDSRLQGTNCSEHKSFICQRECVPCRIGGEYFREQETCYKAITSYRTWEEARSHCTENGATLATPKTPEEYNFISTYVVPFLSETSWWLGLSDVVSEGQYYWIDGLSLGTFDKLNHTVGSTGNNDCVRLVRDLETEYWQSFNCSENAAFICQYPNGDSVPDARSFVSGTVPSLHPYDKPTDNLVKTSAQNVNDTTLYLWPGSWFTHDGFTESWLFTSQAAGEIHLQVYRPSCPPQYTLLPPGCSGTPSPYASCVQSDSCSVWTDQCQLETQHCPLTGDCLDLREPCSCSSPAVAITSTSCSAGNTSIRYTEFPPVYTLVGDTVVKTSATEGPVQVLASIEVETNDIVGLQTLGDLPIKCQYSDSSEWGANFISRPASGWFSVGENVTLTESVSWTDGVVCDFRVKYGRLNQITPAGHLVSNLRPVGTGPLTYEARMWNSISTITESAVVILLYPVLQITLVCPPMHDSLPPSSVGSTGTAPVEAGVNTTFLFRLEEGTNVTGWWSLSQHSVQFSSGCPIEFQTEPQCRKASSLNSFTVFNHQFELADGFVGVPVTITAANPLNQKEMKFDVLAMDKVSNATLTYTSDSDIAQVTTGFNFTASISAGTHYTYTWTIDGATRSDHNFSYSFSRPDIFPVLLVASNAISLDSASTIIKIYTESLAANLSISVPSIVATEEVIPITLLASLEYMSKVEVTFSFSDTKDSIVVQYEHVHRNQGAFISTTHVFNTLGQQKISAVLLDKITGATYNAAITLWSEEAINGVILEARPSAIEANHEITFMATKDGGTGSMYYSWDFGDSTGSNEQTNSITHTYTTIGIYNATVAISNNASIVTDTKVINVCQTITGLTLSCDRVTLLGNSTLLSASVDTGSHIDYIFNTGEENSTPFTGLWSSFDYTYQTTGVYNVSVQATNAISHDRKSMLVYVIDSASLYVLGLVNESVCVENGVETYIAVDVIHMHPEQLYYEWVIERTKVSGVGITAISYTPTTAGLVNVYVAVQDTVHDNVVSVTASICVQESVELESVTNNGPLALPRRGSVDAVISAIISNGTDCSYTWSYGRNTSTTTSGIFTMPITSLGDHVINVTVANDINSVTGSTVVSVQEVIQGLDYTVVGTSSLNLASNNQYILHASKEQGSNEIYTWYIGSDVLQGMVVNYTFSLEGNATVRLVAENNVSRSQKIKTFTIIEPVSSVVISASDSAVQIGGQVQFNASTAGPASQFQWRICDQSQNPSCSYIDTGSSNQLTHQFALRGVYNVTVHASNLVSNVSSQASISVMDEIEGLSIVVYNLTRGRFAQTGKDLVFVASANEGGAMTCNWTITSLSTSGVIHTFVGSEMTYEFSNIGPHKIELISFNELGSKNTSTLISLVQAIKNVSISEASGGAVDVNETVFLEAVVQEGSNLTYKWEIQLPDQHKVSPSANGAQLNYVFPYAGTYQVDVEVTNPISAGTGSRTIYADVNIGKIEVDVDYLYYPYIETGRSTLFSVTIPVSSTSSYRWTFTNDYTSDVVEKEGRTVSIQFDHPHTYSYSVNVSNPLGSGIGSDRFYPEKKIVGVAVSPSSPEINIGSSVEFTIIPLEGTNLTYLWALGENPETYHEQTTPNVRHTFTESGDQYVTLMARNHISNATKVILVKVKEAISGLRIRNCCNVPLQKKIQLPFVAEVDTGAYIEYHWVFSHSSRRTEMQGKNVTFSFPTAGRWTIYVSATNDINSKNITVTANVQEYIRDLTIDKDPDPNYVGQMVTFTAITREGSDLEYQWYVSPICDKPSIIEEISADRTSRELVLNFTTSVRFCEVSVEVYNNISTEWITRRFGVLRIACPPPDVQLVGENKRSELRSRIISIEALVDLSCTKYVYIHQWTIFRGNCSQGLKELNKVELPESTVTNTPTLFMTRRTLEYGDYCIRFRSKFNRVPAMTSIYLDLEVTVSPLQAIIFGGNERTVSVDQQLTLDGSLSFDPDLVKQEGLNYLWECLDSENRNCFDKQETDSRIIVPSNKLTVNTQYEFLLTVSKGDRISQTVSQTVLVKPHNVPTVNIDCVSCRDSNVFTISGSRVVKLLGSCENCREGIEYSWSVIRSDGLRVQLDADTTTTGSNSPNLVVRNGVLSDNYTYVFSLTVISKGFRSSGYSFLRMESSQPPSSGWCEIEADDTVVALVDSVNTKCEGWISNTYTDSALLYHVYVQEANNVKGYREWYPLYRGTQTEATFFLSQFQEEQGEVDVRVEVIDGQGIKTLATTKRVLVKSANMTDNETLVFLDQWVFYKLQPIQNQNNPRMLIHYIITILLQINMEAARSPKAPFIDYNEGRLKRLGMRSRLVFILTDTIPISGIEDVQQMAYSLYLITAYVLEFPKEYKLYVMVIDQLEEIVRRLAPQVTQGWRGDEFVPVYLLATIGNLIETIHIELSGEQFSPYLDKDNRVIDREGIIHRQRLLEKAVTLADEVTFLVLQTQVANEEPFSINTGYFSGQSQRVTNTNIKERVEIGGTVVEYPVDLLEGFPDTDVFQIVSTVAMNPFIWGYDDGQRVTSQVTSVSFAYSSGEEVRLADLPEDQRITIKMHQGYSYAVSSADGDLDSEEGQLDQLTSRRQHTSTRRKKREIVAEPDIYAAIKNETFTRLRLGAGETLSSRINTSYGIVGGGGVIIRLKSDLRAALANESDTPVTPSVTAYIGKGYVPHKFKYRVLLNLSQESDQDDNLLFSNFKFMDVDNLNYVDKEDMYYITIVNNNQEEAVNVSIEVFLNICKFYDTAMQSWSTAGCRAVNGSTPVWTVCECNHLTLFGASVTVAPSDLDFSDLLGLDLAGNPVVLTTVCIVAAMYVVLAIIGRHWDTADLRNLAVVPLCGKNGPYKYEVSIITGRRPGAGTTAHVGIKLYGEESKSTAIHLTRTKAFARNAQDVFLVAQEHCLGDIWKIHIWHDNAGLNPSWFLARVVIRDLQSNRKYFFLANQWLSLTHEEGAIEKDLFAAGASELSDFQTLFKTEVSRGFSERHLWLSVLDRPPTNRFTRVQRVTCCAAFIYAYLCANAMWYGYLRAPTEYEQLTGNSYFSWMDILVGIIAAVMVFPIAFAVIQLFRKSKRRAVGTGWKRPSTAQTIEIDIEMDSRESSATTFRGRRRGGVELIHLEELDRESTGDSLPTRNAAPLRRTSNVRGVMNRQRTQSLNSDDMMVEQFLRDLSDMDSTYNRSASQSRGRRPSFDRHGHMWGPDTILTWPERIPAWQETDSRPTSHSQPNRPPYYKPGRSNKVEDGKPPLPPDTVVRPLEPERQNSRERRFSNPSRSSKRRVSVTDSIDELLQDPDLWSRRGSVDGVTLGKTSPKRSITPGTAQPVYIPGEEADKYKEGSAKDEPTLDELIAELQMEEEMNPKPKRKSSMKRSSTPGDPTRRVSLAPSTVTTLMPAYPTHYDRSMTPASTWSSGMQFIPPPLPKLNKKECLLPHWFVFIGYILCVLISAICIIVTLLYGHVFGRDMSLRWLTACLCSFMLSAFILEPLKVVISAAVIAAVTKTIDEDPYIPEIQPVLESNEKIKQDPKIRPLGGYALLQAKEEGCKVKRMRVILRQFAAYAALIILILTIGYVACYGPTGYRLSEATKDTFFNTQFNNRQTFFNIKNDTMYWDWLENVGGPGIHQRKMNSLETSGFLLGRGRLRQIRSTTVDCPAAGYLRNIGAAHLVNRRCVGDPSWEEDTSTYGHGWTSPSMLGNWSYSLPHETGGIDYLSMTGTYEGGGYVRELGLKSPETKSIIRGLKDDGWIDRNTRAVFLEFSWYQPNVDMYVMGIIAMEFPVSGGTIPTFDISPILLKTGFPNVLTIFMGLLGFVMVYFIVRICLDLKDQKTAYFCKGRNWQEMFITVMIVNIIVLYGISVSYDTDALGMYLDNRSGVTILMKNARWDYAWKTMHASLLFTLMIVVTAQFRFIKPLSIHGKTLKYATPKLIGCLVFFAMFVTMFSQLGHLWFGTLVYGFRGLGESYAGMVTILRSSAEPIIDEMVTFDRRFGPVFVSFFVMTIFIAVFGLVLAVLTDAYKVVKSQLYYHNTLEIQDYEMVEFMLKRFKQWIGATKPKPAFRKVKFQGLPSASSRSTWSGRSRQSSHVSSETTLFDLDYLDELEEEGQQYLDDLLDRAVPTFEKMLEKLDTVDQMEEEDKNLDVQLEEVALMFTPRPEPSSVPHSRDTKYRSQIPRPIIPARKISDPTCNRKTAERSRTLSASGMSERPVPTGNRPPGGAGRTRPKDRPYSDQGQRQLKLANSRHGVRPSSPDIPARQAWET